MPTRFVCFTPYHLILAETIAEQLDLDCAEVVFADESGLGTAVKEMWSGGRMRLSERLAPIGATAGWRRLSVYARNRHTLRTWARGRRPGSLYLFNPLRPESRAVAARLGASLHFVEDGVEAYVEGAQPGWHTRLLRRAGSLAMGVPPFLARNFLAYGEWVTAWALLPEHLFVPPGTSTPPLHTVDRAAMVTVIDRWCARAGLNDMWDACDVLVMLDHPDVASGLTIERAVYLANSWGVDPTRVLVKPHPRDRRWAQERGNSGVFTAIDGRWPIEVAFRMLRPGAVLVGGSSTGMLTAAVLRPDFTLRLRARHGSPMHALLTAMGARVRLEAQIRA